MNSRIPRQCAFFLFWLFGMQICFAKVTQWEVSSDGKLLNGILQGQKQHRTNWVIGIWQNPEKCTQSYPCFFCTQGEYYEFLTDGTFRFWKTEGGNECVFSHDSESKKVKKDIQYQFGTYHIIDAKTVQLNADWIPVNPKKTSDDPAF